MPADDFSFLSERVSEQNLETENPLIQFNPIFTLAPEGKKIMQDKILLRFKHRLWIIPTEEAQKHLTPYYSKYYKKSISEPPFLLHDIIYKDLFLDKTTIKETISCTPTLSFRTLIYNHQNHIKFGLPIEYGAVIRLNKKEEVLASLYLSDYIRTEVSIPQLDFFLEYKGYSISKAEDYSVSYRSRTCTETTIPFGCYFNKILNSENGTPEERLTTTLRFVSHFLADLDLIYKELNKAGLGLEIHGQNLLIKLSKNGEPLPRYCYRDLGICTLSQQKYIQQEALNEYYQLNYDFTFKQIIDPAYFAWMNYRCFLISFILFNLDNYAKNHQLDVNCYQWFDEIVETLPTIKAIY